MAEQSTFDRLVANLSAKERRDLLERIRRGAPVSADPLFSEEVFAGLSKVDYETKAGELGLLARLILFFRRLVSGRSYEEILSSDELRSIARTIEVRSPGLVDHRRALLLEGFLEQLRRLRDAARFFSDILTRSFEKDRGAFVAFLASIELPELHARLLEEADPFAFSQKNTRATESEVRAGVLEAFDAALESLTEDKRRAMYRDLRSLLFLRRLGGFLYERLIGLWKPGLSATGLAASFGEAHDLLLELGDILFSLSTPPSVELMEALFVFAAGEEIGTQDFDAEALLSRELQATEEALNRIRAFNLRLPFAEILRLVSEEPGHRPRDLPGGEDWFAIYRAFWKERIESRLESYRGERRYKETITEIAAFIGPIEQGVLPHVSREGSADSPPIRLELALAFLDGFYRGPFIKEFNRSLKILLVDGEFYRKDNRLEFTDVYNELLHLPENLAFFDARLAAEGDIGAAYALAKNELVSLQVKRRKLQGIERGAEDEAERLVRRAAGALQGLVRILQGLLKGEAGGRYDSLQNLAYLDGKGNKEFLRSLEKIRERSERALNLLREISGLDLGNSD